MGNLIFEHDMPVKVKPHSRPRVSPHGHVYQPTDNLNALVEYLVIVRPFHFEPINYPVIVNARFFFIHNNKSLIPRVYPIAKIYGDLDNLTKTLYDSLVKAKFITDDRLIVGGTSEKLYASSDSINLKIFEADHETKNIPKVPTSKKRHRKRNES